MPIFRPDEPLATIAALPAGQLTILPPAERPPDGEAWTWQPGVTTLQIVASGTLPLTGSGGGCLGKRVLKPGDTLLAMAGSWSRRRFAHERRLFSLTSQPGGDRLVLHHFRPSLGQGRPPERDWNLHGSPAMQLALASLAACSDIRAAGCLAQAVRQLLPLASATIGHDADDRICRLAGDWLAAWTAGPLLREACATAIGVHPDHLTRCYRRQARSWHAVALQRRLAVACTHLLAGHAIGEVAGRCGWDSASHFIAVFRHRFGATPQRWRSRTSAA